MIERFDTRWNGERWRLWAFIAGFACIAISIVVAVVVAAITGERVVPLVLLFLVASILIASLIGSGIIDTLSSQLNRGGLARESTEDIDRAIGTRDEKDVRRQEESRREMRTIRAGLFVIAPIIAFLYFMWML